jgi:hypothetical protein
MDISGAFVAKSSAEEWSSLMTPPFAELEGIDQRLHATQRDALAAKLDG